MKKISAVVVCSLSLLSVAAFGDETKVSRATRSVSTGNDVVVAVTACSFPERYQDLQGNPRIRSTFTVTSCKETKSYDVNVYSSTKWYKWGHKDEMIPGTETFSYAMASDNKEYDEAFDAQQTLQFFSVQNKCNDMREGFVTAAKAGEGKSKCK